MNPRDQGLGLSLLIYLMAMLCGLAVVVLPVYFANRPTVIRNAGVQTFDRHEYRAAFSRFRLLHLKHQTIVTPAELAQVDAQERKAAEHKHPVHVARRTRRHRRPPPRNAYAEVETPHRPTVRPFWTLF